MDEMRVSVSFGFDQASTRPAVHLPPAMPAVTDVKVDEVAVTCYFPCLYYRFSPDISAWWKLAIAIATAIASQLHS